MDFKQIKELINLVNKTKISELKIEKKDFKINIRSKSFTKAIKSQKNETAAIPINVHQPSLHPQPLPAVMPPVAAPAPAAEAKTSNGADNAANDNLLTIKSPMIGTFYRAPGPDKDPFIKIGDHIDAGTVICMIEAMKLFNEIESEVSGKVVKIFSENNSPVEYDQPLFLVEPS